MSKITDDGKCEYCGSNDLIHETEQDDGLPTPAVRCENCDRELL